MVKKNYQAEIAEKKNIAKAMAKNQHISVKYSTEICREIKGKLVKKAIERLERIIEQKEFLPLKKYNKKVPHRKGDSVSGVKSGRFPESTCRTFLKLLESVKANADFKGMDAENLAIVHCFASSGFKRRSMQPKGKISGKVRRKKSSHIEIVVMEAK